MSRNLAKSACRLLSHLVLQKRATTLDTTADASPAGTTVLLQILSPRSLVVDVWNSGWFIGGGGIHLIRVLRIQNCKNSLMPHHRLPVLHAIGWCNIKTRAQGLRKHAVLIDNVSDWPLKIAR